MAEGYIADTAEEAMKDMFDTPDSLRSAERRGISARIISWTEYEQNYFERMRPSYQCPHLEH